MGKEPEHFRNKNTEPQADMRDENPEQERNA